MEPLCEFCGVMRAVVYCKSDSARLCLQCDACVHSANLLSRRHARSLLCDKCNSQPAIVRCMYDKLSVCQGCDWDGNACVGLGHQRQALTCYSGCPSLVEFSRVWAYVLDEPSPRGVDACSSTLNVLPINENCVTNVLEPRNSERLVGLAANKLTELQSCSELEPWMGRASLVSQNPTYMPPYCKDQAVFFPEDSSLPKDSNFKDIGLHGGDNLCEGIDMEDVGLNLEDGNEMSGCLQGHPRYHFEDAGMDHLLIEKNLSVTESNGPIDNALEASSSGQQDCMANFQSSGVGRGSMIQAASGSANHVLINPSCNRSNVGLVFPVGQIHSSISLSLSNITSESSAVDYQDCGLSPMFMTGESPWEASLEASCPKVRDKAKMRYNEKKKTRTFGKQIRYASRKARADTRKRVKGRFVKAGEAYDYDPLMTRDF